MLKAVLFDLDDTLIDWSGAHEEWDMRERTLMRARLCGVVWWGREMVALVVTVSAYRPSSRR